MATCDPAGVLETFSGWRYPGYAVLCSEHSGALDRGPVASAEELARKFYTLGYYTDGYDEIRVSYSTVVDGELVVEEF
jgi:hypothetical protein